MAFQQQRHADNRGAALGKASASSKGLAWSGGGNSIGPRRPGGPRRTRSWNESFDFRGCVCVCICVYYIYICVCVWVCACVHVCVCVCATDIVAISWGCNQQRWEHQVYNNNLEAADSKLGMDLLSGWRISNHLSHGGTPKSSKSWGWTMT